MLISSPSFIVQSYTDWYDALAAKNLSNVSLSTTQDISIMGVCRRFLSNPYLPNWPFLLFGFVTLLAAALRIKQYQSIVFRLQLLSSVLMMVVLFSTGSEHPTYVIAVTGALLWVFLQQIPFTKRNIILLVLLLVITGLGPTDAFPKYIRNEVINNYVMKAWPCIVIWFIMSYELLFKDFLRTSSSYIIKDKVTITVYDNLSNTVLLE